jgi:PAS domain S-box-containing protein
LRARQVGDKQRKRLIAKFRSLLEQKPEPESKQQSLLPRGLMAARGKSVKEYRMQIINRSPWLRYGIAVVAVTASTLLRLALDPVLGTNIPYATYFLAVLVTAWACGLGPALLALFLGAVTAAYFFIPPHNSMSVTGAANMVGLILYLSVGIIGALLSQEMHRARRRAESNARIAQERQAALERKDVERQKAEETLRIHSQVLENMVEGVTLSDEHGRILYTNPAEDAMFGYERGELIGQPLTVQNTYPPEENERIVGEVIAQLQAKGAWQGEFSNRRKDGTPFTTSARITALEMGGKKHRVCVQEDITERKRAEEAIRFQAHLLSTVEQAVIATDPRGTITYWNRFAERLYGWSAAEAIGRNVIEITPAETVQGQASEIMTRLKAGQSWSGEMLVQRRDGTTFPAIVTDTPIYDEQGEMTGIVGVSADITELKEVDRARLAAEQRAITEYEMLLERLSPLAQALGTARDLETIFRALLDFALASMPCIGIFIALYDPKRNVRTAAYAWGDGAEVDVSSLPPMPISTDGPNSRAVRTGEIIITDDYLAATTGHPSVKVGVDNGLLPQSSMAAPMAVMGRIVGTIEVQSYQSAAFKKEHVTAMRMAANLAAVAIENVRLFELEISARTSAEASNRLKDEFLATLSHELRTPLTAVLGWLSLLRSGKLDEATRAQALDTIERNANVQAQLIEDILDVSRVITGKLQLDVRRFDLSKVIDAAITSVRPAAEAKQIRIETMIDTDASMIWGDANRLQQVIWNLLSNAVKFTPRDGRIEVRLKRVDSHTEIVVSDTGPGISADFLPYVFDRFRQADSTSTRAHSGLGLGLAIVRHLTEMHGGSVRAESDGNDRGATFTLELPVRAVLHETEEEVVAYQSGEDSARLDSSLLLEGVEVLVVDNEADARELVRKALEQCGARVTTASSTAEALGLLERLSPNVLVSDIGMPGEDGYDLIRRVRALEQERGRGERLPAVALTAYVGEEDRRRVLSAGFQEHVAKPVELKKLTALVASLAGRNAERESGASV